LYCAASSHWRKALRLGKLRLDFLILDDAPCSMSMSSILPGWSRHLRTILSSLTGSTPLSEAMMT
jgi:hypothetical protein